MSANAKGKRKFVTFSLKVPKRGVKAGNLLVNLELDFFQAKGDTTDLVGFSYLQLYSTFHNGQMLDDFAFWCDVMEHPSALNQKLNRCNKERCMILLKDFFFVVCFGNLSKTRLARPHKWLCLLSDQ